MVLTVGGLMLVSYKPGFFSRTRVAAEPSSGKDPGLATTRSSLHQRLLQSVFMLGLGSSLAYAIGYVLRGSAVRSWNEPVLGALLGAISGLLLHLLFSSGKRELLAGLGKADRKGVWLYALMGVTTISAQMCAIASMRYIPLSIATLVTLCTPVLVFPLSHLLFKNSDDVSRTTLLGCGLTLLGISIIVMR
jgi:drug/metabolite transporter (DMT)-like permease